MTRRSGAFRDPTERRATSEALLQQLLLILTELPARERAVIQMRFGLLDGEPKTYNEIGAVYGVTRELVGRITTDVMSKLRQPNRLASLAAFLDEDIAALPEHVRARALGRPPGAQPQPVRCDRHGWFVPHQAPQEVPRTCPSCPCPVLWGYGRPSTYCSNACRQAAYRRRKRAENERSRSSASRTSSTRQRSRPRKPGAS